MDLNSFKNKFDWKGYISKYPDLYKASSFDVAWNHANNFGWKENRVVFDDDNHQKSFIKFKKEMNTKNQYTNRTQVYTINTKT